MSVLTLERNEVKAVWDALFIKHIKGSIIFTKLKSEVLVIMGRRSKGIEVLDIAKNLLENAKTADEIRICQAVIFPLEGLTIEQTAAKLRGSVIN